MENDKPPAVIPSHVKKLALESAMIGLMNSQAFYGGLVQELIVKYDDTIPTAGIGFNKEQKQFQLVINPNYFIDHLKGPERVAVLNHEVLHFINKHIFRWSFANKDNKDKGQRDFRENNIAADMEINQYIKNLPKGCVNVKDWKLDDGTGFPLYKSMEEYYSLIKEESKKQKKKESDKEKGKGSGTKGNVNDMLDKYVPSDIHFWDELTEEEQQKMLEEAKKLILRTIEKTANSFSTVPDSVKDLLKELDVLDAKINHKQILKQAIKRSVSVTDRDSTWKKPNKRYGTYSPGSKMGDLPKLDIMIDTSGSISHTELNQFLGIMNEFLKVGSRSCNLGLWNTSLYYKKRYKMNQQFDKEEIQSGGTDVNCVIEDISKSKPDLTIILTDLYFEEPQNIPPQNEIIWIVSEGGNENPNFKQKQKIIYLKNLK